LGFSTFAFSRGKNLCAKLVWISLGGLQTGTILLLPLFCEINLGHSLKRRIGAEPKFFWVECRPLSVILRVSLGLYERLFYFPLFWGDTWRIHTSLFKKFPL